MMLNLGMIDIYEELGETSKALQKVEQFPWTILEMQKNLVQRLEKRSMIKFSEENGDCILDELDENLCSALKKNAGKIVSCRYKGLENNNF